MSLLPEPLALLSSTYLSLHLLRFLIIYLARPDWILIISKNLLTPTVSGIYSLRKADAKTKIGEKYLKCVREKIEKNFNLSVKNEFE